MQWGAPVPRLPTVDGGWEGVAALALERCTVPSIHCVSHMYTYVQMLHVWDETVYDLNIHKRKKYRSGINLDLQYLRVKSRATNKVR